MYMIDEELKIFLEYKNLTNIVFRYTRKCETNNKKLNKNVLENSFNSLLFIKKIYNIKNIFTNIKFLINRASPVEIPLPSSPPLSPIDKPLPSFPVEKPINTPIEFINIDKILQVILVLLLMY